MDGQLHNISGIGYYRYWGKADGQTYHLLAYHNLDIAACGSVLLRERKGILQHLSLMFDLKEQEALSWVTFFLSLHDTGKFGEGFQSLQPELRRKLQGKGPSVQTPEKHWTTGLGFIETLWSDLCEEGFFESGREDRVNCEVLWDVLKPWMLASIGHHGRPPSMGISYSASAYRQNREFPLPVKKDGSAYVRDAARCLLPETFSRNVNQWCEDSGLFLSYFERVSWLMAGLAVMADWLGSNTRWFSYHEEEMPLDQYWKEVALPCAEKAVSESGLQPVRAASFGGMKGLFPSLSHPTPLQRLVQECSPCPGPELFLIEEVTGGGKTEAALTLVHRFMASGRAEGVFLALPTMATANAMHRRVEEMYQALFDDNHRSPSFILSHSAAKMAFALELKNVADTGCYERRNSQESASAQCSAWLWDSRKKALLAHVGVGTIDQVLLSVLPARHQSLRLFGLTGKVLVVDEVHACDPYMLRLLERLLEFLGFFYVKVILLSATLPQSMRKSLAEAYAKGAGLDDVIETGLSTEYPLLTRVSGEGLQQVPFETQHEAFRTVNIRHLHTVEEVMAELEKTLTAGGCACWIRNTVNDAIEAFDDCVQRFGRDRVLLFHARFALADRLRIEAEVLANFGPQSTGQMRTGKVLIATQVVEQSLDLDFDAMVTDLAPIDVSIQRAGRLRRHCRDRRGNRKDRQNGPDERGEIVLGVFMAEAASEAGKDWYSSLFPHGAFVYPHHGRLWLTARWLQEHGKLSLPQDAREVIEYVYGEESLEVMPPALQLITEKEEGNDKGDSSFASRNALSLESGYEDDGTHWLEDVSAPTRLGEPTVRVRLARVEDNRLIPWCRRETDYDWQLSELTVRAYLITKEASSGEKEIEEAKQAMPDKGKYCVVIPLQEKDGLWQGVAVNKKEETVNIEYDVVKGLTIDKGDKS